MGIHKCILTNRPGFNLGFDLNPGKSRLSPGAQCQDKLRHLALVTGLTGVW